MIMHNRTMATQTISPLNSSPIATFYLGHFPEGAQWRPLRVLGRRMSE